jgi:hypothetical protein
VPLNRSSSSAASTQRSQIICGPATGGSAACGKMPAARARTCGWWCSTAMSASHASPGAPGASSPSVQRDQIEAWARLQSALIGQVFEELAQVERDVGGADAPSAPIRTRCVTQRRRDPPHLRPDWPAPSRRAALTDGLGGCAGLRGAVLTGSPAPPRPRCPRRKQTKHPATNGRGPEGCQADGTTVASSCSARTSSAAVPGHITPSRVAFAVWVRPRCTACHPARSTALSRGCYEAESRSLGRT